jgi:hypothetical protein
MIFMLKFDICNYLFVKKRIKIKLMGNGSYDCFKVLMYYSNL